MAFGISRYLGLFSILCALVVGGGLVTGLRAAPGGAGTGVAPSAVSTTRLVIHYHRHDGKYAGWNVWVWAEGKEGRAVPLSDVTAFGRSATVELPGVARAGFTIRRGEWEAKDIESDRFVALPAGQATSVWLVSGDETVYPKREAVDLSAKLGGAFLDGFDRITLAVSAPLDEKQLGSVAVTSVGEKAQAIASVEPIDVPGANGVIYQIKLKTPAEPAAIAKLELKLTGFPARPIFARDVLNDAIFVDVDTKFGAVATPERTVFSTWSPVADAVELVLYRAGGETVTSLERKPGGTWTTTFHGDLHGTRYRYRFTSYGQVREVVDVHCFAATSASDYSVVVDMDRLKPANFDTPAPRLAQPTDEVIYEIHVRDYSIRDETASKAERGTYLGLVHESPGAKSKTSRGISHLLDLGVSAVHLLPVQDFTAAVGEYNWGYWTALFNVPESNYSTDPADPTRAIIELRSVIGTLHQNKLRVILDVVYNHTSSSGKSSPFDQTVPFYYFRTTASGRLMNDAGVGNSIADERPMVREYILDSLEFWARQYNVDGFRFDLIGTHRPETVAAICARLLPIRSDLTLYGEPWTGGGQTHFGKGAQKGSRMALFNDNLRGAIRGDLDGKSTGFATGPGGDAAGLVRGVRGSIDDFTTEPIETVNYVSAHDNRTLWDKLEYTSPGAPRAVHVAQQKLAMGIVLTSQGIPFLHGGCDFARTKGGDHNSYNAGDAVNAFDWDRKAEFAEMSDYVAGLVKLRRAHPAFRMADDRLVRDNLKILTSSEVVSYTLNGKAVGDGWGTIFVAYNGAATEQAVELPAGRWQVVVNARQAGEVGLTTVSGSAKLPPFSMIVAWQ